MAADGSASQAHQHWHHCHDRAHPVESFKLYPDGCNDPSMILELRPGSSIMLLWMSALTAHYCPALLANAAQGWCVIMVAGKY